MFPLVYVHNTTCLAQLILDENRQIRFQSELSTPLMLQQNAQSWNKQWKQTKNVPHSTSFAIPISMPLKPDKRWESASATPLYARKTVRPNVTSNGTRRSSMTRSLRDDRAQWRIKRCREIEKSAAFRNSRNRLLRYGGPWRPVVKEVTVEADCPLFHSQERRLEWSDDRFHYACN